MRNVKLFILSLVFVCGIGSTAKAGVSCAVVANGATVLASHVNCLRTDMIAFKAFDSAGAGTNYIQMAHSGTEGTITTNAHDLHIIAPSTKSILLKHTTGTTLLTAASTGLTSTVGYTGTTGTFSGALASGALTATTGTFSSTVTGVAFTGPAASPNRINAVTGQEVQIEINGTDEYTFDASNFTVGAANKITTIAANNLILNAPSGQLIALQVAGTNEATLNATTFDLQNNALTTTGNIATTSTGTITSAGLLTATAGIKVGASEDTLANYRNGTTYADTSLTLGGGSVNGFTITSARYNRIGTRVFFDLFITWTSITTPSGAFTITNCLPTTAKNSTSYSPVFLVISNNVDLAASAKNFVVRGSANSRACIASELYDDSGNVTMTASQFDGNVALLISGSYESE